MIHVILLGRTGNNLFQYAFGRVLAERHQVPLILDGGWFNRSTWAGVSCLERLPLQARVERTHSLIKRLIVKLTRRHWREFSSSEVVREPASDHRFQARYLEAGPVCLVRGYFQSPLYFHSIANLLRAELALNELNWPQDVCKWALQMASDKAVAVHVRRGDYVGNPDVAVCNKDYYLRAIEWLRERYEGLQFFVFSDDPSWCATQFPWARIVTTQAQVADPLEHLFLMSLCHHHIIANSTYSWWAAWLGNKPGQQVIVPPRWYASGITAPIAEKLCPGWQVLDVPAVSSISPSGPVDEA